MMRPSRGTPRRTRTLAVATVLASVLLLALQSASASAIGLSTTSSFEWPASTTGLTNLHEPLYFYQPAAYTTWSQTMTFANGGSEVASSRVLVDGEEVTPEGGIRALLVWRVTGKGTSSFALGEHDVCETHAEYSQCFTTLSIPPGSPAITSLKLFRSFHSANGNYWWAAALQSGSTQTNAGLIQIPGEGTQVSGSAKVLNSTNYVGLPASLCSEIPQSTVAWFSPWQGTETGGGEIYATYKESSIAPGTCESTFTGLNLGGKVTGVKVKAPTE
jgi:hypothetical protein